MNAQQLVELAMQKSGKTSQHQMAAALGVSHVAVGKWMRGENCPTFEQAAELAVLAGLPPVRTAAEVRQHSIDGRKHSALLKKMAALAAGVVLAASVIPSHAAPVSLGHKPGTSVYYVKL